MGKKIFFYVKKVQRALLMICCYVEQMADCLVGIDKFLLKSGTLTLSATMHPFHGVQGLAHLHLLRIIWEIRFFVCLQSLNKGRRRRRK